MVRGRVPDTGRMPFLSAHSRNSDNMGKARNAGIAIARRHRNRHPVANASVVKSRLAFNDADHRSNDCGLFTKSASCSVDRLGWSKRNERMGCRYDGEDLQIAFNAKFMVEMLNCTQSTEIRMELATSTKAGIMKPMEEDDNEELLMLVMPLMLNQ